MTVAVWQAVTREEVRAAKRGAAAAWLQARVEADQPLPGLGWCGQGGSGGGKRRRKRGMGEAAAEEEVVREVLEHAVVRMKADPFSVLVEMMGPAAVRRLQPLEGEEGAAVAPLRVPGFL